MPNNKITIGKIKESNKDTTAPDGKEERDSLELYKDTTPLKARHKFPNQDLWGNESDFEKNLTTEILTEKRRYVRVRYLQNIQCKSMCGNEEKEPKTLPNPLTLSMFDISMGGIGVLCCDEIQNNSILYFSLNLDNISYEVSCKVTYCIKVEDTYRLGLKILNMDKQLIRHLKILVTRLSM